MSAADIIISAFLDGMHLAITAEGRLHYSGSTDTVVRWLPAIREMKTEIHAELERVHKRAVEVNSANVDVSSRWWRIHYPDGTLKEASYCPPATRAEVMGGESDALTAEPFAPFPRQPNTPLPKKDEAAVLAWLRRIGETDEAAILDVLKSCHTDADARGYFIRLAQES